MTDGIRQQETSARQCKKGAGKPVPTRGPHHTTEILRRQLDTAMAIRTLLAVRKSKRFRCVEAAGTLQSRDEVRPDTNAHRFREIAPNDGSDLDA